MGQINYSLRVWDLMKDASVNAESILMEFGIQSKLSRLQSRALLQIFIQKAIRLSYLAIIMGVNSGNLSRVCQSLENAGFIQRERSLQDRREWLISLTEKGKKTTNKIVRVIQKSFESFREDHSEEELDQLIRLWTEYSQCFNKAYQQIRAE